MTIAIETKQACCHKAGFIWLLQATTSGQMSPSMLSDQTSSQKFQAAMSWVYATWHEKTEEKGKTMRTITNEQAPDGGGNMTVASKWGAKQRV